MNYLDYPEHYKSENTDKRFRRIFEYLSNIVKTINTNYREIAESNDDKSGFAVILNNLTRLVKRFWFDGVNVRIGDVGLDGNIIIHSGVDDDGEAQAVELTNPCTPIVGADNDGNTQSIIGLSKTGKLIVGGNDLSKDIDLLTDEAHKVTVKGDKIATETDINELIDEINSAVNSLNTAIFNLNLHVDSLYTSTSSITSTVNNLNSIVQEIKCGELEFEVTTNNNGNVQAASSFNFDTAFKIAPKVIVSYPVVVNVGSDGKEKYSLGLNIGVFTVSTSTTSNFSVLYRLTGGTANTKYTIKFYYIAINR